MQFDFEQQPGLIRWNQNVVKTEKPLVSIITPYYNGGRHIRQTCSSVLDQTFPYFEWIIVDDGSTNEEDVRILEEIAAQDPRIRILHKENGGPSSARNYGIRHSRTDLILPLDSDDLLEPPFIEYCWWMLQKNPGAAWAYVNSVGFEGMEYLWKITFDPVLLKTENHLTITALIRKEAFLAIGGYSEEYKLYNEDWQAWLKLVANGNYPVQSCGEYLFWYRRTDVGVQSMVQTDKRNAQANRRIIASAAAKVTNPKSPVIYPKPFSYHWTRPQISKWEKCVYEKKEKKHIVFLLPHLVMGGADKFNLDLISGLDKEKYDTSILTTIQSPNDWLQRFRKATPNIFNLANFVDPEDYAEFISYYLKSRKADALFVSNSYHGYYLIPWLRENFPELVIVDYVHMEEWYWRNGGYARTSAMVGAVTEKTYVCNSATRDVMIDHFGRTPESVETVHIGVDEAYFDRSKVKPGTLYQELGISDTRPVVLFVCRLHPQKRPFLMLEIAKKVTAKLPNAVFAVVGEGPQEAELRQKIKKMGLKNNVYFLGPREDVRPYYRDAKVTLICSLKEGLALTAYESCSMGVPVVSADVGGQKDLIDDATGVLIPCMQDESDGFDSRTFEAAEADAYAGAIVKLLTDADLWAEKSLNCRRRVEQAFTIDTMVRFFDQEFAGLLSDEMRKQKRLSAYQTLHSCSPLAAELFTAEMQMQSSIDAACGSSAESLTDRIRRTLREEGIPGFLRRIPRWIWRRIKNILRRI